MPVFSYLAYPAQGAKEQLLKDLSELRYCEITPANNEEILILITDTPDEDSEKQLQKQLKELSSLQSLGMAACVKIVRNVPTPTAHSERALNHG